ncbi:ISAs1 family transposase, partial [Caldimonas tepidiphila]|uniref:ISAs1 family transposase n=1 Tax=Caldimonas tepidiphila TaxID=2315841 RepID=UPI0023508D0D
MRDRRRAAAHRAARLGGRRLHARRAASPKKRWRRSWPAGAQLLVQLKANQPRLLRAMRAQAQQRPPAEHASSHDIGRHNRIERRLVRVWALAAGSGPEPWHDHFLSLIEVRRTTEVFDTTWRRFVARRETPAYYLSTLGPAEVAAREFARLVREHWAIENRLHHVLDVTLAEDASRIRRNPGVFAG